MKKMICIVLSIAMMISCVIMPVGALAKTKDEIYMNGRHGFGYVIQKDNTVKITSYHYFNRQKDIIEKVTVKIPSKINGKKVTALGSKTFNAQKAEDVFGEAGTGGSVIELILPSTMKRIDANAVREVGALEKVSIPDSVEYIGDSAFLLCKNLREIHIGKNVKYIGGYAFYRTPGNSFKYDGGAVYLDKYLIEYEAADAVEEITRNKTYTVLEGTTLIADEAFDQAYSLSKIVLPKSIKYIPERIFGDESGINITFYGYRGTAAEKFAKEKGATFKALNPAAPKITVKAGKKKLKVSWKSVKTAEGYQIKYNSKTTETKKLKKTIKLKKGTYKVKARCYKIKNGKRVYSPWSKAQTVKVK